MNDNTKAESRIYDMVGLQKEDAINLCKGFQTMLDLLGIKDTDDKLPAGSGLAFERLCDAAGLVGYNYDKLMLDKMFDKIREMDVTPFGYILDFLIEQGLELSQVMQWYVDKKD